MWLLAHGQTLIGCATLGKNCLWEIGFLTLNMYEMRTFAVIEAVTKVEDP